MKRIAPLFFALSLGLVACGGEDPALAQVQDTSQREQIQAWMKQFDEDYAEGVKTYGTGEWKLPGDNVDNVELTRQTFTSIVCENLHTAGRDQPISAGGKLAQVRALWLYVMGGCAGVDSAARTQSLAVLEGARRSMGQQWEKELDALPGSVRIEVRVGNRAKMIDSALLLGSNEHISCMGGEVAERRNDGREMSFQNAMDSCRGNEKILRYGVCPITWQVISSHQMADQANIPRDDHAWVADATARFRMGWRACSHDSLAQWQGYLPHIPQHLREGRLRAISAPADPLMMCQSYHFSRLRAKTGHQTDSQSDNAVMGWCAQQFGLRILVGRMAPPRLFTTSILNDTGQEVSWLYDPSKATQRPREWAMTNCMKNVAQKLAVEGLNVPSPPTLRYYCSVNNGAQARDYLSGQARIDGLARLGPPPQ